MLAFFSSSSGGPSTGLFSSSTGGGDVRRVFVTEGYFENLFYGLNPFCGEVDGFDVSGYGRLGLNLLL